MSYQYPFENYRNDVLHRLRTRVEKNENGCLEWKGARTKGGYGTMTLTLERYKSKTALCHRVLWEFENDVELGRKIYVCHRCDTPACLNMAHLYVGTAKVNSEDMVRKGRSTKGRKVPFEKRQFGIKRKLHTRHVVLDEDTVRAIRAEPGNMKTTHIAEKYNISNGYVSKLRNGQAKTLVI